jgi:RHS repeat-associated protein
VKNIFVALIALVAASCGRKPSDLDADIQRRTGALTEVSQTGWVASASVSSATDVVANAIDGAASTRWSSGVNQAADQWFQVDLGSAQTFNEVTLDSGTSTGTFPAGYKLSVSNDGADWGSPVATGAGGAQAVSIRFLTKTARYIKVTLTAAKSALWTIHDLRVWLGPQLCDACQAGTCQVATCDPMLRTAYPPSGLIGLWHLDGDGKDASDNGNHFTVVTAATTVHGVDGMGMSLVAGSALAVPTNWSNDPTSAPGVSFAGWVKPTGACPGTWPLYVRNTQVGVQLTCTGTGTPGLSAAFNLGSGFTYTSPVGSVPLDAWSMVAMTWDKGTARFYVNGTEVGSASKSGSLATASASTWIGTNGTTSFVGTLDEPAVYARALTPSEVSGLAGAPPVCGTAPKCPTSDPCLEGCNMATSECYTSPLPKKADNTACDDGNGCTTNDVCTNGVCGGAALTCAAPSSLCDEATCDQNYGTFAASDVIGQWHFDGDLVDSSGHGLNLTNGTTATPVEGRVGQAMHFDASTTHATVALTPSEGFSNSRGVTLAAWVKPDAGLCPSSTVRTILGRWADFAIGMKCKPDNTLGIVQQFNGGFYNPVGTLPVGQWSHVVMTYSKVGSYSFTYINGSVADGVYPVGGPDIMRTNKTFYVGDSFSGAIDEAIVLRRFVTGDEIGRMAESPVQCNVHPKTCVATDSCHATGTCDPQVGCTSPPKANGTPCSDQDVCTSGETCQAGTCTGGTTATPTCPAPGGPCVENGTCDGAALPKPPQDGLLGWWRFEGDTRDSSGHGLDLKRVGGEVGTGKVGMALEFDGNTCAKSTMYAPPQYDLSHADGVTMMAWVKPNTPAWSCPTSSPIIRSIMGRGNDFQMVGACWGSSYVGLTNGLRSQSGTSDSYPGYGGSMPSGVWSLVTVTWDRATSTVKRYVNGSFLGSRTMSGYLTNFDPTFGIGCMTTSQHPELQSLYGFKGSIDEATLYTRALPATEILQYYNAANTNTCKYDPKPFATACDDGDPNTTGDECRNGTCLSSAPIEQMAEAACIGKAEGADCSPGRWCEKNNVCHNGVCGGGDPADNLCLQVDSVADLGASGQRVALFGYVNRATNTTVPSPNQVKLDGAILPFPQPPPPAWLPSGTHAAVFKVPFQSGHTVAWRVNGQQVSTAGVSPTPTQPGPHGDCVMINGSCETVRAELAPYLASPEDPFPDPAVGEPALGQRFNGVLSGSLAVSPTGAATYSVPIAVPPGIAGMAPNLGLSYNSQGGDGIAGHGWNLGGQSMIHRCAKTRLQDGESRPIRLTTFDPGSQFFLGDDGLCLDGEHLYEVTPGVYESEREDFSKITSVMDQGSLSPDHISFKVETKAGEVRYYGSDEHSRVSLPGEFADPQPAIWALDRVVDTWGNYLTVEYNDNQADFDTRGLILTRINYTGHEASGSVHCDDINGTCDDNTEDEVQPFTHVRFTYVTDTEGVRTTRFGSASLKRNSRLTKISSDLGTYALEYLPKSATSAEDLLMPWRLGSIAYCKNEANCSVAYCQTATDCLEPLMFDWEGGGYAWERAPFASEVGQENTYELPIRIDSYYANNNKGDVRSYGSQFVDLNGDGRVDLVQSMMNPDLSRNSKAWENNGHGWTSRDAWALPLVLTDASGIAGGVKLADMNGDGFADVVVGAGGTGRPDGILVYLNRIPQNPSCTSDCWQLESDWEPLPSDWLAANATVDLKGKFFLADMDADGLPDLVWFEAERKIRVLHNTGSGWSAPTMNFEWPFGPDSAGYVTGYHLEDYNRDGLTDLVPNFDWTYGVYMSNPNTVTLNLGSNKGFAGTVWQHATFATPPAHVFPWRGGDVAADVDGDGLLDSVTSVGERRVAFGTGIAYTANGTSGYMNALDNFAVIPVVQPPRFSDVAFGMADINADGLPDYIVNYITGGRLLVNTGATWKDLYGETSRTTSGLGGQAGPNPIPVVPSEITPELGAAFVDLDGDGVTDHVQSSGSAGYKASYLNKFRPPIITKFPNGLARKSEVAYVVITSSDAQGTYSDDHDIAPGTTHMAPPLRVVEWVAAEDGTASGTLAKTTYFYSALRSSSAGRGPQGFRTITVQEPPDPAVYPPVAGPRSTTMYAQAFPFTGKPLSTVKYKGGEISAGTLNKYCAIAKGETTPHCSEQYGAVTGVEFPAEKAIYVYPMSVKDQSYLPGRLTGSEVVTTISDFSYDDRGNLTTALVTTENSVSGEKYLNKTENEYIGTNEHRMGKVTKTTVTAQRLIPLGPALTHRTGFEYAFVNGSITAFALVKKKVEPGSSEMPHEYVDNPYELHTAYAYDRYGNVVTTTSCANDLSSCQAGASGPPDSDDPNHQPFRTTTVSYEPNAFVSPAGSVPIHQLSYLVKGRFPVTMTTKASNAVSHVEQSAYDWVTGQLRQKTGVDGVTTCYEYDAFGQQTDERARCGASDEATTSRLRYWTTANDPAGSKVVTVTRPAIGSSTWVYADALGHELETKGRGFTGDFIRSTSSYDVLGRLSSSTKAHFLGAPAFATTPHYDKYGRVDSVTQDLGSIDGTSAVAQGYATTTYQGSTVTTDNTIGGVQHQHFRSEEKNGLGKVSYVQDANGGTIRYTYDPDGNLTQTEDNDHNHVTIQYDLLGRKSSSQDPDLGTWRYFYNAFGDLIVQIDGNEQPTIMTYDRLGRLRSKTDANGRAEWLYDVATGAGIGKLAAKVSAPDARLVGGCSVPYPIASDGHRAASWFAYNAAGNVQDEYQCTDGEVFRTSYEYDQFGRKKSVTYPEVKSERLTITYHYTQLGFLHYVAGDVADSVYWQALSYNALGQVEGEVSRNGVQTTSTRNASTGWLMASFSIAQADGDKKIQDWKYHYDEAGNLTWRGRSDAISPAHSAETFAYDSLDRILSSTVTIDAYGQTSAYDATQEFTYDKLGNFLTKDGRTYQYAGCGGRPHAVCSVDNGPSYTYDANGNMIGGGGRTVTYTPSNKPRQMTSATGDAIDFMYGPDDHRVVQNVAAQGGVSPARTIYVGLGATGQSLYERTTSGGKVEHTQFLYAGGTPFALRVIEEEGSIVSEPAMKFYSFDHLGSVTAMSDAWGQVVTAEWGGPDATVFGYDPWGARRNPDGHPADPATFHQQTGHREFTGHETIPTIGLVNMNGRVYDPVLGRFLSADPHVQFVADLQSYNRYAYGSNNPLRYTDPTGYSIVGDIAQNLGLPTNGVGLAQFTMGLMTAAACAGSGGAACAAAMVVGAIMAAGVMRAEGASWDQVIAVTTVNFMAGGLGSMGAQLDLNGPGGTMLAGLISGTISSVFAAAAYGAGDGMNIFHGIASAVASSAMSIGIKKGLSQASGIDAEGVLRKQDNVGDKNPDTSPMTDATPSQIVVNELTNAGHYLGVIYDPDVENAMRQIAVEIAKGEVPEIRAATAVFYNPDSPKGIYGQTDEIGVVLIGKSAFRNGGTLETTLFHEAVHVDQLLHSRWYVGNDLGRALNELEAYDAEIRTFNRFNVDQYSRADALAGARIESMTVKAFGGMDALYRTYHGNYRLR